MNSQKPLAIGIIGSGNMGRHHLRVITEYGASVVAVHDVQSEAARELTTHADGALATTDLDAFFRCRYGRGGDYNTTACPSRTYSDGM